MRQRFGNRVARRFQERSRSIVRQITKQSKRRRQIRNVIYDAATTIFMPVR